jgi:hypothetical protein
VELASNSIADVVSSSGINSLTVYIANHTNDKTVKCDLTATSSLGNKISNPSQNHQTFNSCQNRLMKKPICWNSMYVTVGGSERERPKGIRRCYMHGTTGEKYNEVN